MNQLATYRRLFLVVFVCLMALSSFSLFVNHASAINIEEFKDTISTSAPGQYANHTVEFLIATDVSPGAYIEFTPPENFSIIGTTTFEARNVELIVDGIARTAASVANAVNDGVTITPGSPGQIRYTLNSSDGLTAGERLQLRIGNHTSNSNSFSVNFSTSTGTTTTPADIKPILNATTTGSHSVDLKIFDGTLVANARPVVVIVDQVGVGPVDTRETVPPERFNGAPTSTVGGTTLNVEISLETNELAICRYSTTPGVAYFSMTEVFDNTGLIFHSTVVAVAPNSTQTFYVRCIDDEDNFNIDDYTIEFFVSDTPTGSANEEGDVDGDGSGQGNDGTGTGDGGGGQTGEADGEAPLLGGSTGGGGSGGGGGGGRGEDRGDDGGGGFDGDGPYRSGDGRVVISGFAFPQSTVTALVDGVVAERTTASSNGSYQITLDEIARGVYTFGVFATGDDDVKSSTFSTSFTVSGARTSALTNINIAPSIAVTPDPVDPGDTLTFSGYAIPNASITLENGPDNGSSQSLSASSDGSGAWSTTLSTAGFSIGTYKVRASAEQADGANTNFSDYTFYGVGEEAEVPINADLNRDGSVNLIDFSILLFWWNTNGGDSDPPADINRDGNVNLTDFSILLFNWTG